MFNNLNFKTRIILTAVSLFTVSMLILSASSHQRLSDLVKEDIDKYANLQMSANGNKVESYIDNVSSNLERTAKLLAEANSQSQSHAYIKSAGSFDSKLEVIALYDNGKGYTFSKGVASVTDNSVISSEYQAWYRLAKSKQKTVVLPNLQEKDGEGLMAVLATPIVQRSRAIGVIAVYIPIRVFDPFIEKATFPGSIAALYDDTGLTISSTGEVDVPGESRLSDFEPLKELERVMLENRSNMLELELLGIEKIAYFKSVKVTDDVNWHMLVAIDKALMYSKIDNSLWSNIVMTLVLLVLSTLALYLTLSVAYKPIYALKATVKELSNGNGDLTQRLTVEREDDLGEISKDINVFISNLQGIISDIVSSIQSIETSANELEGLRTKNDSVLLEHRTETSQVATALNEMTASSNEVAHSTEDAVSYTQTTNRQAEESKSVVFSARENVGALVTNVTESSTQINQMADEISNISAVLKVIGDIAEQTNLLALNAAIEAARAGEQGRGFAVVADEVRALASRTQDSTTEIYNTINRLNDSSKSVISGIESTKLSCEETSEQIYRVVDSLDNIVDSVGGINDLNTQIATAARQQSSVSEDINQNMISISDMVEEFAHSSQQVNQATGRLLSANNNLIKIVSQFKI